MNLFTAVELFTQVITYVMIVAGVPPCINMLRTGITKGVPYPFFVTGIVNSVMGIGYGFLVENMTFVQINSFATVCNVFYISSFIYTSRSKTVPIVQLLAASCFVLMVYLYITKLADESNLMDTIGIILLMCSAVLLSTPLLEVKHCIEDKSAAHLSLVMLTAGFLCSGAWFSYGMLLKDFYIYV